jgi:hypothetical protein
MFAGFEKRHTVTDTERSITLKVFLAQFFNTAFVPLLVYARLDALARTTCQGGAAGDYDPARPVDTFGFNGPRPWPLKHYRFRSSLKRHR